MATSTWQFDDALSVLDQLDYEMEASLKTTILRTA